jgi:hypothetical protein
MRSNKIADFKIYLALAILTLFAFSVVATFGVIVADGLGRLKLPPALLNWLGGATVGEIAGMLYIIIKSNFSNLIPSAVPIKGQPRTNGENI